MPFPLEPIRVEAAERTFGARFPRHYCESMIRANGGCVVAADEVWWLHPLLDDSDVRRLKRTCNDVIRETREAAAWPGFPAGALAIANNGAGDLLVFLPGPVPGALADAVYRFDHETTAVERIAAEFAELPWTAG